MSESVSVEMLTRMLERLPGAAFCARMDPATQASRWLYLNARVAELYGVDEAVVRADPWALMTGIHPDDRATMEAAVGAAVQAGKPMAWVGRWKHPDGTVRWGEVTANVDREADGSILWYGQAVDITERTELERSMATAKKADMLHRAAINALPVGIIMMEPNGNFPIYNRAADKYAGRAPEEHGGDLTHAFGVFETDGVTPFPNERLPLMRTLAGEEAPEEEMIVKNRDVPEGCWVHVKGSPIRDEGGTIVAGMVAFHDVSHQRKLEQELRARNEQLAASEEAKIGLIERLRYSIDELSNPILEVWDDVLVMPIIGVVDSRRTADMVRRLLAEVTRTQASFVIIDLTGVEIVDTRTADHLMKLMKKVEIVGARCVLTGIRGAVAETLVDIGVDLGRVTTLRNLKHGLREALRFKKGQRDMEVDLEGDRDPDGDARPNGKRARA